MTTAEKINIWIETDCFEFEQWATNFSKQQQKQIEAFFNATYASPIEAYKVSCALAYDLDAPHEWIRYLGLMRQGENMAGIFDYIRTAIHEKA
jgi:hypothetical protein